MANPKLSIAKKDSIGIEIRKGGSNAVIANRLGVATGTVSNVRRGLFNIEVEMDQLKIKEKMATRGYKDALKEIRQLKDELDIFAPIVNIAKHYRPLVIKSKQGGRGEATAIINVNDWHFEERVDKAAVNGVNEYNLRIAKRRLKAFWASAASLVDMCRSRSKIDTIIVNILGDMINGWIHEPFMATNALTPTEAILEVFTQLLSGLEFLQKETKVKEIIVPCVCGNHGRWTKRKWSKLGPGTSFEGLLYSLLARWHEAQKNKVIRFILPQGDMTYYKVYGRMIRITHGDNLRYSGGIGGVHIPLRKALDGWNTQIPAKYTYIAHYHQDLTGEDYRMSGSVIGFSEYCIKIKARYNPPSQAFELQHPKYGATARFPIILQ